MRDKTKDMAQGSMCACLGTPNTTGQVENSLILSLSHARSINNATALWGELCNGCSMKEKGAGKQEDHRERGEGVAAADWGFSRQDKLVPVPQLKKIHP